MLVLRFQDKLQGHSGEGEGKEIFAAEERVCVKTWSQERAWCSLHSEERVAKDHVDRQLCHVKDNVDFKGIRKLLRGRKQTVS